MWSIFIERFYLICLFLVFPLFLQESYLQKIKKHFSLFQHINTAFLGFTTTLIPNLARTLSNNLKGSIWCQKNGGSLAALTRSQKWVAKNNVFNLPVIWSGVHNILVPQDLSYQEDHYFQLFPLYPHLMESQLST